MRQAPKHDACCQCQYHLGPDLMNKEPQKIFQQFFYHNSNRRQNLNQADGPNVPSIDLLICCGGHCPAKHSKTSATLTLLCILKWWRLAGNWGDREIKWYGEAHCFPCSWQWFTRFILLSSSASQRLDHARIWDCRGYSITIHWVYHCVSSSKTKTETTRMNTVISYVGVTHNVSEHHLHHE
jgi:hypothetical protein